jgi:D-threo-aldose 1-dehydrogenase
VSDDGAVAAIDSAWECGVRYLDTAPHYGLGLSEERLGMALATRPRTETVLPTKVGRLLVPAALGAPLSLDQSLSRLGVGSIDIVLVHDPDDHSHQASRQAVPTLRRLRDEGVIGAVGVGMNESAMRPDSLPRPTSTS